MIAAAPKSFGVNNQMVYKYVNNEFQYVGAQQEEEIDLGLKENLDDDDYDDEDGDEEDTFENFQKRNQEIERQKKMNQTMDLRNA